jgi:purine nucleosidase
LKIHLDTDLGGDIDDLCALALLLRWPGVELTGVTTCAEAGGKRAGFVRRVLALEGRDEIPVAAGAEAPVELGYPEEARYWGEPVEPSPNAPGEALALLRRSVEQGAVVAGVGPYTNLRLLEETHPGLLRGARLFLVGGTVFPPPAGFPHWPVADDYNIQVDVASARRVIGRCGPTLVPLSMTAQTYLTRAHLPRLEDAGALGRLVARQAAAFASDENFSEKYGATHTRLPPDIINFQHDSLACALALGWDAGVELTTVPLRLELRDGLLHQTIHPDGTPTRLITHIHGDAFSRFWLDTILRVKN